MIRLFERCCTHVCRCTPKLYKTIELFVHLWENFGTKNPKVSFSQKRKRFKWNEIRNKIRVFNSDEVTRPHGVCFRPEVGRAIASDRPPAHLLLTCSNMGIGISWYWNYDFGLCKISDSFNVSLLLASYMHLSTLSVSSSIIKLSTLMIAHSPRVCIKFQPLNKKI